MICGPIPPSEPQENHWLVQLAIQSPACPMSPTHVLKCNLSPTWKVETRPSSPDMPQGPPRRIPHLIQYSPYGLMQWTILRLPPQHPHLLQPSKNRHLPTPPTPPSPHLLHPHPTVANPPDPQCPSMYQLFCGKL